MAVLAAYLRLEADDGFVAHLWPALGRNPILLLPVIVFAVACAVRRALLVTKETVTLESVAPPGLTPAESGVLLHGSIGSREVAATLVDLSVKKFLSIADATPQMSARLGQHDLVFRALKPESEWHSLAPHEKTLLYRAFRDKDWVPLSQLREFVSEALPAMHEQVKNSLWEKGMYPNDPSRQTTPRWKSTLYVLSLMGMLNGFTLGQLGLGLQISDSPVLAFLMIAITMGVIVWAMNDLPNWTEKGARTRAYLEGLRQFIAAVDADRLQRLDRYRFDGLLPYAIVFGIEQKWAAAFQQLAVQPLAWFGSENTDSLLRGSKLTVLSAYLQPLGSKK